MLWLMVLLAGCSGGKEEPAETPELSILEPAEGATVAAGEVAVSLVVEHFSLVEPGVASLSRPAGFDWSWLSLIPAAHAHEDEQTPEGWVALTLDGADAGSVGATVYTLTDVAAGSHTLTAQLVHEDGEPLEPPITATVTFTAE